MYGTNYMGGDLGVSVVILPRCELQADQLKVPICKAFSSMI